MKICIATLPDGTERQLPDAIANSFSATGFWVSVPYDQSLFGLIFDLYNLDEPFALRIYGNKGEFVDGAMFGIGGIPSTSPIVNAEFKRLGNLSHQ